MKSRKQRRQQQMKTKLIASPYLVWMVVFILVPLLMVAYFAFTDGDGQDRKSVV